MPAFNSPEQAAITPDGRALRAAVAAYLGRYRGQSRLHTGSDLKIFLTWCSDQDLDPLWMGRADIERYVRWLQETRYYQPSTVSRRLSVVVGFYRTCVIDQILPYSPADYVRRPPVPAESPTLGLGHLQFEALITAARLSPNINDFALIAVLGLLGLRIFEACGANINNLSEEHGHRVMTAPYTSARCALISPVVKPFADSDRTMSSTPVSRRCRFLTICGSNEASRSRGTVTSTGPTSVSTVLARAPLREFPPSLPAGSCFS
ncbi:hypothetical protein GCM10010166_49420 [Couchioplanes caeruleus subsp. azureus]|nr:hypothetical protein GCM10010166_49420 [Couchioplanes caeruleus subsp. azureus]